MGTRADFYVGKGQSAEWIGSIAWDGNRDGIPGYILKAKTEATFRKAVAVFFEKRDDVTLPAQGWPWPWDDSSTSDCSYWFFDKRCWDVAPGDFYFPCDEDEANYDDDEVFKNRERVDFPDMSARKNVTFGKRSGVIIVGA